RDWSSDVCSSDLILRFGGHHDDEVRKPGLAQIGAYFRTLLARQHPIEQYDVRLLFEYQLFSLIAIPRLHYRIILGFKAVCHEETQVFIVFDDRYFDVLMHIFYTILSVYFLLSSCQHLSRLSGMEPLA